MDRFQHDPEFSFCDYFGPQLSDAEMTRRAEMSRRGGVAVSDAPDRRPTVVVSDAADPRPTRRGDEQLTRRGGVAVLDAPDHRPQPRGSPPPPPPPGSSPTPPSGQGAYGPIRVRVRIEARGPFSVTITGSTAFQRQS